MDLSDQGVAIWFALASVIPLFLIYCVYQAVATVRDYKRLTHG